MKKCIICGNEIESTCKKSTVICAICKHKRYIEHGKIQEIVNTICPKCGKILKTEYNIRGCNPRIGKVSDCKDCISDKEILRQQTLKEFNNPFVKIEEGIKEIQIENVCPYCGNHDFYVKQVTSNKMRLKSKIHSKCTKCYVGFRKWSKHKKEANAKKWKELKLKKDLEEYEKRKNNLRFVKDVQRKLSKREQIRQERIKNGTFNFKMSELMKKNNPMFKKEIVEKMKQTTKENILNGKITFKRGKEHWNFVNGTNLSRAARERLYNSWIYPILERDEFKCQKCGSTSNLQVHHLKPLIEIVKEVLKKYNIEYSSKLTHENLENFDEIRDEIIKSHKLEDRNYFM